MSEDNTESELIEVRLNEDEISAVIFSYVDQHLRPESITMFYDVLEATRDIKVALHNAVFNEMANNILEAHVRDAQDAEPI